VFLESWSDQALVISQPWDGRAEPILIDVDSGRILSEPDAPVLVESSYGRYHRPVPGVGPDELIVSTAWSPDGTMVAANITPESDQTASLVRIVDTATGTVISERDGNGSGVISMTWSTDGRFLLYTTLRSTFRPGLPGPLVIHDVISDVVTTVPLSQSVDQIRTQFGEGADPIP
jgi:WD40 repeat protein